MDLLFISGFFQGRAVNFPMDQLELDRTGFILGGTLFKAPPLLNFFQKDFCAHLVPPPHTHFGNFNQKVKF